MDEGAARAEGAPIRSKPPVIKALTGIRGVFACYVMFYHLSGHTLGAGRVKVFIDHGYLSVDLFFILSGFVMALTYQSWFVRPFTLQPYWRFLSRRLARIYPLYVCVTALFCVIAVAGRHATLSIGSLPGVLLANLAMVQSWGIAPSLDGPAWSISTEWAAYLLFPLVVWGGLRGRWRAVGLFALSLAALALICFLPDGMLAIARTNGPMDIADGQTLWPLARCLALFSIGVLAWRTAQSPTVRHIAAGNIASLLLAIAIFLLLFDRASDLLVVTLCALLIVSVSTDQSIVARLLGTAIVFWLGEISYSLYMVHMLMLSIKERVIMVAAQHDLPFANLLITTALSLLAIAVAAATHRLVEQPGRVAVARWAAASRGRRWA